MWCVPEVDEEFVERMEDVLRLYELPHDPQAPVVCLDEKSVQCLDDKRKSVRVRNGSVRRDYEYVRKGTVNVFCAVEAKAGRHFAKVTPNRKKLEFARMLRDIARAYPITRTIHIVMDNLSTHSKNSLVHAFGENKGTQLWNRFTVHYTPKHASWLNQAEIEIGLYARQCLGKRRIGSFEELRTQTNAWRRYINKRKTKIDWNFNVRDARGKFHYFKNRGKINLSRN